ncbi:MAG: helix-hairpin-helix domain-containing protein [Bacilli bacterium]|nr:helix-hairpin-helix domain-containing protein [Bacilli bacterium]
MVKILIGVVVVTVVVIATFLVLDPKVGIVNNGAAVTEVSNSTFTVTVEGEVYKPGNYTLEEGKTIGDLLEAAGGVTSSADARAYYETAELVNGSTYYIASLFDATDICSSEQVAKANINSDDAETLSKVNGITSTIANSIITYRTETGLFSTLEQLQEVYGIGPATYKKIRGYVILHA